MATNGEWEVIDQMYHEDEFGYSIKRGTYAECQEYYENECRQSYSNSFLLKVVPVVEPRKKFVIWRHQEYITINPREYLLDDDGNVLKFDTTEQAIQYLNEHFVCQHFTTTQWEELEGIHIDEEENEE
jgi:hypothetical protein